MSTICVSRQTLARVCVDDGAVRVRLLEASTFSWQGADGVHQPVSFRSGGGGANSISRFVAGAMGRSFIGCFGRWDASRGMPKAFLAGFHVGDRAHHGVDRPRAARRPFFWSERRGHLRHQPRHRPPEFTALRSTHAAAFRGKASPAAPRFPVDRQVFEPEAIRPIQPAALAGSHFAAARR